WGAIVALALTLEASLTQRSVFRAALAILGSSSLLTGIGTVWWLQGFRPPLTYISFGFFQPLFLAALFAGVVVLDTLLSWRAGPISRRDLVLRAATTSVALLAILPFAGPLWAGLARGLGYVVGHTTGEVRTSVGYVSYPKNWLKGIFEARPLFADGI